MLLQGWILSIFSLHHWSALCFIQVRLIHSTNTPNKSHHIYPENTIIYDTVYTQQVPSNIHSKKTTTHTTVDGSEIRRSPVEVDSLSLYLQGFGIHPRWLFPGFLNHQPCHLTPKKYHHTSDAHHFGQVGSKLTSLQHSLEGRTPLITKHVCRYRQKGGVSWTLSYGYFLGVGKLPYISRTAAAYIGEDLHFGYLKCLVI